MDNQVTETVETTEAAVAAVETSEATLTFESFGFKPDLMTGVKRAGFKVPSPIQAQAIPIILGGSDIVAQAHTGTGKTAAFGLPTMNNIDGNIGVEILIITPTRELANQVSDEMFRLGAASGVRTVTIYGGMSQKRQIDLVQRGAQVVVATPGRLLDLLSSGKLNVFNPRYVVLDEADEMLDMGFLDDIQAIFNFLPQERQTLLFSATMPAPIKKLAERILSNPKFISVTKEDTTNVDITQEYYVIEEHEREDAIVRLIDVSEAKKIIVFCRMKIEVDNLATALVSHGYQAKGLHGDMEQRQREEVIKSFRAGRLDILVATDVAARGLDVSDVTHVINYHIPFDPESYVHRIGRTGRAGNKGTAITLVTPLEFKELQRIKHKVGSNMKQHMIPTLDDVKQNSAAKLIDAIKHQPINPSATAMIQELEDQMDMAELLYKMAAMVFEKQQVRGPNEIGLNEEKLKRMLQRFETDGRKNRGGFRGRGGSGPRNRRGSGSGSGERGGRHYQSRR